MIKVKLAVFLAVLVLLTLTACTPDNGVIQIPLSQVPVDPASNNPDDIVFSRAYSYRGNIEVVKTTLSNNSGSFNVFYRDNISTKAGETRNNIVTLVNNSPPINRELEVYAVNVPPGIKLQQDYGGGLPGTLVSILMIDITPGTAVGKYSFNIGIKIDGKDFGMLPCTINVIE